MICNQCLLSSQLPSGTRSHNVGDLQSRDQLRSITALQSPYLAGHCSMLFIGDAAGCLHRVYRSRHPRLLTVSQCSL